MIRGMCTKVIRMGYNLGEKCCFFRVIYIWLVTSVIPMNHAVFARVLISISLSPGAGPRGPAFSRPPLIIPYSL